MSYLPTNFHIPKGVTTLLPFNYLLQKCIDKQLFVDKI
nr:MAG TPA: hypothetical protein [Bacteriophage sp.]